MIILNAMKLINLISTTFGIGVQDLLLKESFNEVEVCFRLPRPFCVIADDINLFYAQILDDCQFDFLYCGNSEITINSLHSITDVENFVSHISDKLASLDLNDPDDIEVVNSFSILVKIRKEIRERVLNIYDFIALCNYWNDLTWENRLFVLSKEELKRGIVFYLLEDDICSFKTEGFYFSHNREEKPHIVNCLEDIRENVYWGNLDVYKLPPLYFHITQRSNVENIFQETFDVLSAVFSLCSILDIVSLNAKDGKLVYKLCGYKNINGELNIDNSFSLLKNTENEYFKIFRWIYIGEGNKTDKIGIARNVLSLFIANDNIAIEDNVFISIQSSFKTYLKENLDKYVAIRNQIYQELDAIISLSSAVKKDFLEGFKHNLLACITFFFSTIVLEVLGGNSKSYFLFTKEVCILCYAVFFISFLYLLWMRSDIEVEKKNISNRYVVLKKRYSDLLIPKEIDIILRNGEELKEQMGYIDLVKKKYTALWICSLLTLCVIVTVLSPIGNMFAGMIFAFKSIIVIFGLLIFLLVRLGSFIL